MHLTSGLVSYSISNREKLSWSLDSLNQSSAKQECRKKTAYGKRDQQLQHIEPKKSRNVTLTPWMSPFMRNVCWGNVWCNTCRINTDKAEWNHLTRNCVLDYRSRKQHWSPTVCHKLHVHFQTSVKVKCVFDPDCFSISVMPNLKVQKFLYSTDLLRTHTC